MTALPPLEQHLEDTLKVQEHHLAQINVARAKAPLDSEIMAGFVSGLPVINRLAEKAEGYVWRLQDLAGGDATAFRVWSDPQIIVNLSVWRSLRALRSFVYESEHRVYLQRRNEWFDKLDRPSTALWWVKPGRAPSLEAAIGKLDVLRDKGATPAAFTFGQIFDPNGEPLEAKAA